MTKLGNKVILQEIITIHKQRLHTAMTAAGNTTGGFQVLPLMNLFTIYEYLIPQ